MRGTWGTQLVLGTSKGWIESSLGVFVVAVAGEGGVGEAGGVTSLGLGQALAFAIEDKLGVIDQLHAVSLGEALRAFAYEVDVRALFEDEACSMDGIAEALDAGDAAGFHAATVHEESIKLDATVGGEKAAAARVEGGIVLEDGYGCLDGVDGGAAAGEDFVTDFEGAAHASFMSGSGVCGDGPCSAMDEKGGIVSCGEGCHSDIVDDWERERALSMAGGVSK